MFRASARPHRPGHDRDPGLHCSVDRVRVRPVMSYEHGRHRGLGHRRGASDVDQRAAARAADPDDWGIDADRACTALGSLGDEDGPLPLAAGARQRCRVHRQVSPTACPPVKSVFQALVALAWEQRERWMSEEQRKRPVRGGLAAAAATPARRRASTVLGVANRADTPTPRRSHAEAAKVVARGGPRSRPRRWPSCSRSPPRATRSPSWRCRARATEARQQLGYYGITAWLNARARLAELHERSDRSCSNAAARALPRSGRC